jgi:hypothetical protein
VPSRAGVEQYVREYLSVQHRDNTGDGCPSAARLDEIGRCTDATERACTDGVLAVIDDITARLAPGDPPSARAQTLGVFALMSGTLQLSRALADRRLADEVLEKLAGRHLQPHREHGQRSLDLDACLSLCWALGGIPASVGAPCPFRG